MNDRAAGVTYAFGLPRLQVRSGGTVRLTGFRLIGQHAGLLIDTIYAYNVCDGTTDGEIIGHDGPLIAEFPRLRTVPATGLVV